MKRLILTILSISAFVSTQAVSADFFLDRVVDNTPEKHRLERVTLGSYDLRSEDSRAKYRDSLYFLSKAKSESYRRYADGRMGYYRFHDAMNELEYLSYYLNEYFGNVSRFERTGNADYREFAAKDLANSRASYVRLVAVTRKK